jgi:acyl carrier protein
MELSKFIENFSNQFDPTPTEELTESTRFRDMDSYDSVTALSVIAMIEDEYNVNLKFADIKDCNTVGELFDLVKAKQ